MLLILIEKNYPLDEVVFYDTGMEFDAIHRNKNKIKLILKEQGIKFTELRPDKKFMYRMLTQPIRKRNGEVINGNSWCGGYVRWGTKAKMNKINNYINGNFDYIGIALDEPKRIERTKIIPEKLTPLVAWNMSEEDCLRYCFDRGYNWIEDGVELYSILDRVSCWCCRNKNLKELENIYRHLPRYWEKLRYLQSRTDRPYYEEKLTIFDLENRFSNKATATLF